MDRDKIELLMQQADRNFYNRDSEAIEKYIDQVISLCEKQEYQKYHIEMYYSIGNAYSDLNNVRFAISTIEEKESYYEHQIYYYRKAIMNIPFEDEWDLIHLDEFYVDQPSQYVSIEASSWEKQLYAQIFVNLGNCYSSVGRLIDALMCYRRALIYLPDFPMAIGNLGIAKSVYAGYCSGDTALVIKKFAYFDLKYVIKEEGSRDYLANSNQIEALNSFTSHYDSIIDQVGSEEWLSETFDENKEYGQDEQEIEYKTWVAGKGLFLNALNDCAHYAFCCGDTLVLPKMLVNIHDDFQKYHGMFNQIKQEYVSTRFLFFSSSEHITEAHFSDIGNLIMNTLDYSNESYYDFLQKTCFSSLHSILDRVAFFLNEYYELGIRERDVSFRSIWMKEKTGKNGYAYTNSMQALMENNPALRGLYWLFKDLIIDNYHKIKPHNFDYRKLRNHLEHKYVKTVKDFGGHYPDKDNLAFYVSEKELYKATIDLLRLVRSVVLMLVSAIAINEHQKKESLPDDSYIPQLAIDHIEDDWKM